jgi:DNA invertase Pin-like site-specific DNA recombinase
VEKVAIKKAPKVKKEELCCNKVYGYARVSTDEQIVDSQIATISRYCLANNLKLDEIVSETISSRRDEREIHNLINRLRNGDCLLVSKLDRIGRGTYDTLKIIDELKSRGVKTVIIEDNIIVDAENTSPIAQMTLTILSAFSQLERDFISERTKSALKAKKESGVVLGRKVGQVVKSKYDDHIFEIENQIKLGVSLNQIIRNLKIGSVPSLSAWVKKRGLLAPSRAI